MSALLKMDASQAGVWGGLIKKINGATMEYV